MSGQVHFSFRNLEHTQIHTVTAVRFTPYYMARGVGAGNISEVSRYITVPLQLLPVYILLEMCFPPVMTHCKVETHFAVKCGH